MKLMSTKKCARFLDHPVYRCSCDNTRKSVRA